MLKKQLPNLEKNGVLFLMMGLVQSLLIVYFLLEMQFPVSTKEYSFSTQVYDVYEVPDIPDMQVKQEVNTKVDVVRVNMPITTLKPTVGQVSDPVYENIEIVSNDAKITESVIGSTESGESDVIQVQGIHFKDVEDVDEVDIEEEVVEDVPFIVVEDVPVYPGCSGDNDALRKCLEESIRNYVSEHFDVSLAQDLGLEQGTKRIFVMFVIDRTGGISNIQTRAPHKRLELEAKRVIESLPKMKAGKQRGRPVGVKYTLPIVFEVR